MKEGKGKGPKIYFKIISLPLKFTHSDMHAKALKPLEKNGAVKQKKKINK